MSALATREDRDATPANVVPAGAGSLMQIIGRIAQDPTVDLDRFERLIAMQERMEAQNAKKAFAVAMAHAQAEMRVVVADKDNSQTRSKYASYATLDSAVRPIYTRHGFSVTFDTDESPKPDYVRIVADVSNGPHERRYHIDMPADGKGAKGGDVMTKTHAVMSAASYGKRGLLILIFNIPVADKWDDDGNAAGGGAAAKFLSEDQVIELRDLLLAKGRDEKKFCAFAKVDSLADIHADQFENAMRVVASAGAKQ